MSPETNTIGEFIVPRKPALIAVAQTRVTPDLGKNLREIGAFAQQAVSAKADLLCFPESALTGYGPRHFSSSSRFDWDAIAAGITELRLLARETRMALVIGAHLPLAQGWANSAFLLGPAGRLLTRYDKAHLYGRESEYYLAGRAAPEVISVRRIRVGLQVCFDLRFPEPFRLLSRQGAQLIIVPSYIHGKDDMWKNPVIQSHLSSRAAENGRFVIFANVAGREQNVPSLIADPHGRIIARARRGARQLILAKIDLRHVSDDLLRSLRTDLYPPPPKEIAGMRPGRGAREIARRSR